MVRTKQIKSLFLDQWGDLNTVKRERETILKIIMSHWKWVELLNLRVIITNYTMIN